ncbi:MAG: 5-formyltetrahydrofolate cyclo-ligase [Kofleriaceae bacterium]|nr:5-formyltetrahydrofolate cyclo-ligase [Kofleriaceae bacterium]
MIDPHPAPMPTPSSTGLAPDARSVMPELAVTLAAHKHALRLQLRAARDAAPPSAIAAESAAVAQRIDHAVLAAMPAGAVVALYAARGSELDPHPIAMLARRRGLRLAYPRVAEVDGGRELVFALAHDEELVPGGFGLREPALAAPLVALGDIDCFLVPGLAFDRAGHRLGYGKGFYDRALAVARSVRPAHVAVGLGLRLQLVPSVPVGPLDHTLTHVATADGVWPVASVGGAS